MIRRYLDFLQRKEGKFGVIDSDFQQLSTVSDTQGLQGVRTIASAAVIAPTTFLTMVTGAVQIDTITPPILGAHMLCLVGGTSVVSAAGNVLVGTTLIANRPTFFVYNPLTAKYMIHSTANA